MNKNDIYNIIEKQKVVLFRKYAEAESVVDKRMKIKNDGVSYSGMDFIKYIPNASDKTQYAKSRGHYWSDVEILYFGETNCFGLDSFIYKRQARTETGKHIKTAFKILNNVECGVQNFKKERA